MPANVEGGGRGSGPADGSGGAPSELGSWWLTASSAFATICLALFAGVWAGPGCQTACQGDFDCVGAGFCDQSTGRCRRECFTDEDCRRPPECRDNPGVCQPIGQFCSGNGRCQGSLGPEGPGVVTSAPNSGLPTDIEGWDDVPGVGYAFIVERIELAGQGRGFDIDGQCEDGACVDNILWPLAELANEQISQGLLGGESLLLVELAGLDDDPYTGYDPSLTVKIYGAEDADDPFFPANNFETPPGDDTCCEFEINGDSLIIDERTQILQARARAPAELDRGVIRSLAPVPIQFTLTVGSEPHPVVRMERVLINARMGRNLQSLEEGLLGGAIPATTLFSTENPYCKTLSTRCPRRFDESTLLDLVVYLLGAEPDIDLDFDGIECLFDVSGDGAVDRCCDGRGPGVRCDVDGQSCGGAEVPPVNPANPASCAQPASIDDGFSMAIAFAAVRASIVGTSN
jgi:hypothetical protein